MEFEDLSKEVKREIQRVAAAFGVQEWLIEEKNAHQITVSGTGKGDRMVRWSIDIASAKWFAAQVDGLERAHSLIYNERWFGVGVNTTTAPIWTCQFHPQSVALMAYGLYRLGLEEEETGINQLLSFTAHEKLELRLSLPREFWPKTWLREEGE